MRRGGRGTRLAPVRDGWYTSYQVAPPRASAALIESTPTYTKRQVYGCARQHALQRCRIRCYHAIETAPYRLPITAVALAFVRALGRDTLWVHYSGTTCSA